MTFPLPHFHEVDLMVDATIEYGEPDTEIDPGYSDTVKINTALTRHGDDVLTLLCPEYLAELEDLALNWLRAYDKVERLAISAL